MAQSGNSGGDPHGSCCPGLSAGNGRQCPTALLAFMAITATWFL